MMDHQQEMEQRLWEYIDGICTAQERNTIAGLLKKDSVWHIKYEELLRLHALLNKEEPDAPSLRFTKNVMEEIAQHQVAPATRNYINKYVIRGIWAFFVAMMAGLIIYFIGQLHWDGNATGNLMPKLNLDANKLNWSRFLNNSYVNIFFGMNAILGLILIDKYMQGKKNKGNEGHWSKGDSA